MSLRIKLIQFLLHTNENQFFYPRLAAYYKSVITHSDPVIIDVGANKGQTINFFLKLYPKATIFAFEPNYKLFKQLQIKFAQNPNIEVVNKGVSNKNCTLMLKETITDETSTFEDLNYSSGYLKMKAKVLGVEPKALVVDTYEVEVISLQDYIDEKHLSHIDVIKIDTEGHELKCLQGLFFNGYSDATIDFIQLEHHLDDMYLNPLNYNSLEAFLKNHSFLIDKKIKHGFGDFNELIFKNMLK